MENHLRRSAPSNSKPIREFPLRAATSVARNEIETTRRGVTGSAVGQPTIFPAKAVFRKAAASAVVHEAASEREAAEFERRTDALLLPFELFSLHRLDPVGSRLVALADSFSPSFGVVVTSARTATPISVVSDKRSETASGASPRVTTLFALATLSSLFFGVVVTSLRTTTPVSVVSDERSESSASGASSKKTRILATVVNYLRPRYAK